MRNLVVFSILLVGVLSLSMNMIFPKEVDLILTANSTQTDVVFKVEINEDKLGGKNFSFWKDGKELPLWMEYTDGGTVLVWVRVPEVVKGKNYLKIKLQKGKSWSPTDVFDYYENFNLKEVKNWFYYEIPEKGVKESTQGKIVELKTEKCARYYVKNGKLYFKGGIKPSFCAVLTLDKKFPVDSVFRLRVWMWGDVLKLTLSESGYGEFGLYKFYTPTSMKPIWKVGSKLDPLVNKIFGYDVDLSDAFDDYTIVELSKKYVKVGYKSFELKETKEVKYLTFSLGLGRGTIVLDYIMVYRPFVGKYEIKY